jgi:hypothetical protein
VTLVLLEDAEGPRSIGLSAVALTGDLVTVEAVATDGDRRWTLSGLVLRDEEAGQLAAWLAGLPGDLTLGADEWTALTFDSPALSLAGRRVPGGVVELRVSVLGMEAETGVSSSGGGPSGRTTDVVLGLALPGETLERAAAAFAAETAALRR